MAFFERGDEANSKIQCRVCKVDVSENSFTKHVSKCRDSHQHSAKFDDGTLEVCRYNTTHIVEGGKMETHLEFCEKYQNKLVSDYQMEFHSAIQPKPKRKE